MRQDLPRAAAESVRGVTGRRLASISSETAELREAVLAAIARREALRIVGAGHWLDAGRPVLAATPLRTTSRAGDGLLEYVPGDLTLTARASTTLAEIDQATREERQWLPLDPFGSADGTLGATVATASAGPLAHAFGTPRDLVLGVELVTGEGEVVRAGGRVVKNVAGFDLTRLVVGAWGTLGVLTEVTVRLRAQPEMDQTIVLDLGDADREAELALQRLRSSTIAPMSLELVNAAMARTLGLGDRPLLLARLGGNAEAVRAQSATLSEIGSTIHASAALWTALRTVEPHDATIVRISALPADLAITWRAVLACLGDRSDALVHASIGRGIVRLILPDTGEDETRRTLMRCDAAGTRIYEKLPAPLWQVLAPGAVGGRLARRVRDAFDPHRLLNPGILGPDAADVA